MDQTSNLSFRSSATESRVRWTLLRSLVLTPTARRSFATLRMYWCTVVTCVPGLQPGGRRGGESASTARFLCERFR